MSLNLQNKYPGRFDPVSADYPQGEFKNRSSPTAQDGSYMEREWLNDWAGFFGALLSNAGVTPNGNVDTAQSSQFYDAMVAVSRAGSFKNATVVTATSTSLAASQVGQAFLLTAVSSTVVLPAASSVAAGSAYKLDTTRGATLSVADGRNMQVGSMSQPSLTMVGGTGVTAISSGVVWWVFGTAVPIPQELKSTCLVNAAGTGAPHETVVAGLPVTVGPSTRLVLPNPFGVNTPVTVLVEAFLNGKWGSTGVAFTSIGLGIGGGYSQGEGIIVQTCPFTATNSESTGGTHGWAGGNIATPLNVRVFVTKKD